MGLEESTAKEFRNVMLSTHGGQSKNFLPSLIPRLKSFPHLMTPVFQSMAITILSEPPGNTPGRIWALAYIAQEIPVSKSDIAIILMPSLYELSKIYSDKDIPLLHQLIRGLASLDTINLDIYTEIARNVVKLKNKVFFIIGAGFSYDVMPITSELSPMLKPLLKRFDAAVDPTELLKNHERKAWGILQSNEDIFKIAFEAWVARSNPSDQHEILATLIGQKMSAGVVSFNWDNLIERSMKQVPLSKTLSADLNTGKFDLFKPHGDVENFNQRWIFPYEAGVKLENTEEYFKRITSDHSISHLIIIGYSESEPNVQTSLIEIAQQYVGKTIRVSPFDSNKAGSLKVSSRHFMLRLDAAIKVAQI